MKKWSRRSLCITLIVCGLGAVYFGFQAQYAAWLGTWPHAESGFYERWSLILFVVAAALAVAAAVATLKLLTRRSRDRKSR